VGAGRGLNFLAELAQYRGEYERAVALHEEALRLIRPTNDPENTGMALLDLGDTLRLAGDYRRAAACLEESIALFRTISHTWGITFALCVLGEVQRAQGALDRARALYEESLALEQTIGSTFRTADSLEGLASLAARQGQWERAAWLFAAADALRARLGAPVQPGNRSEYDRSVDAVHRALGDDAFAAAWDKGRVLPVDAAVALALEADPPATRAGAVRPTQQPDGLTARELAVLRLVSEGLSDRKVRQQHELPPLR
jgi:tetratricopeptide (TPR) repeat protein